MSKKFLNTIKSSLCYAKSFLLLVVVSAIIGVSCGVVGGVFHKCLDGATTFRYNNVWIVLGLPIAGVLIAWVYGMFSKKGKLDTNRVIESVQNNSDIPLILAPIIFGSTIVTQLFGGSAGREGAALQLGGSLGYNIAKVLKINKTQIQSVVMAGMAGVFAALFGTPVTAAVFAVELAYIGVIKYGAFMPCVISSTIAYAISAFMGNSAVRFTGIEFPQISFSVFYKTVIIVLLCAILSIAFCVLIKKTESSAKRLIPNSYIRAIVGGSIVVILTIVLRTTDYNGAGMEIVNKAMQGIVKPEAFAVKMLFTVITLAAGYKGGEIVPTLFIGATFGGVVASILGLTTGYGAAVGFVALFCGVTNCPIASVFLATEVFGAEYLLVFAGVCAITYVVSGKIGLYSSQKFAFSKISNEETDACAK